MVIVVIKMEEGIHGGKGKSSGGCDDGDGEQ